MSKTEYKVKCVIDTISITKTIVCDRVEWSEAGNYVFINVTSPMGDYEIVEMYPISRTIVERINPME
jgi:hypothetical protein